MSTTVTTPGPGAAPEAEDWPARLASVLAARQRRRDELAAVRAEMQARRDQGKAASHARRQRRSGGGRR
jgi:hypothetical protein